MGIELAAILAGLGLHQTRAVIDRLDTDSDVLKRLPAYAVGYVGTFPLFAMYLRIHGMSKNDIQKATAGYWIVGTMVGIGVFIGYVLDHLWSKRDE